MCTSHGNYRYLCAHHMVITGVCVLGWSVFQNDTFMLKEECVPWTLQFLHYWEHFYKRRLNLLLRIC